MIQPAYLSAAELFDLTGRKQRPSQIGWLRANRWRYTTDADGNPRVLRAYRDKRLLDDRTSVPDRIAPDFSALA